MTEHRILLAGLIAATIGNALVAGVFFAFSSFVMPALARIASASGVSAMQSINIVVVPSLFIKLFLLTTIVSAVFIGAPAFGVRGLTAWLAVIAGMVAIAGSAGVTMWLNVPLNDALAGAIPESPATASQWADYLRDWTRANSARALASAIASALFLWATLRLVTEP